ncbi:MAG: ABC transporter ATP-binding protein [Ignavibacteriales bacterium]
MLLDVKNLRVAYGVIKALDGVDFCVDRGEIVTLIGSNGAGKSTTLRALSGLVPVASGSAIFEGRDLTKMPPHRIVAMGVAHVPEGRHVFPNLTVMENLQLATFARRDRAALAADYDRVFQTFPRLKERKKQPAGTLSGGEQQMLALGRALMSGAKVMLLDEPSMGLAPVLVDEIFEVIQEINRLGTTILLVEQNAYVALEVAHRGYVLRNGKVILSGPARDLAANPEVRDAYLAG